VWGVVFWLFVLGVFFFVGSFVGGGGGGGVCLVVVLGGFWVLFLGLFWWRGVLCELLGVWCLCYGWVCWGFVGGGGGVGGGGVGVVLGGGGWLLGWLGGFCFGLWVGGICCVGVCFLICVIVGLCFFSVFILFGVFFGGGVFIILFCGNLCSGVWVWVWFGGVWGGGGVAYGLGCWVVFCLVFCFWVGLCLGFML